MTTILITGAGRGIGRELARQAVEKGWRVIGSVRRRAEQAELVPEGVELLEFDVTDGAAIKRAAETLDGPVDILVNNAGVIGPARQSTLDMDFEGFSRTLAVNTIAPLRIVQAFLPHLRRSGNARIVNISSGMGRMSRAQSDRIAYRASKAALNKVTQGLATDLAGEGVTTIAIHPGWVRTDMGGSSAEISPEESAAGILAIAENATSEVNGSFLNWDGSRSEW